MSIMRKGGDSSVETGNMVWVASPTTWGHGGVPAPTAATTRSELLAKQHQGQMSMSVAHIITREHEAVPGQSNRLEPNRHSAAVWNRPCPSLAPTL